MAPLTKGRLARWLLFAASGAAAYFLTFREGFWPVGRVIAGWYSIIVIIVVIAAGIIKLSMWWGLLKNHPFFDLW